MDRLSEAAERLLVALWAGAVVVADGMQPMVEPQSLPGRNALPCVPGGLRELIDAGLVRTYTGAGTRWVEVIDAPALDYLTTIAAFGV